METNINQRIGRAICVLRPNAVWILRGDDYSQIEWLDTEQTAPSWPEVEAEMNNPTPQPQPTVSEKLTLVGLTLEDLKEALGL